MAQKCAGTAILVRIFHTGLCFAITASLLWKDTGLRKSLVDLEAPVYGGMFVGLIGVSLILYFVTCLTDPGYVNIQQYRQQHQSSVQMTTVEMESEVSEEESRDHEPLDRHLRYKYRFCDYCEIQPPLRSKHCEDCKACVRRYDHHCPWLEACVGERNHKFFWSFLLCTSCLIIWTFIIVWESFITRSSWTEWFHLNLVLFFDIVVLVLSGPVVIGLLLFHTYLMVSGQTTWEASSRERITYLKYLDENFNPFNEGCCKNIYNFMCIYRVRKWETLYAQKAKFKDSSV